MAQEKNITGYVSTEKKEEKKCKSFRLACLLKCLCLKKELDFEQ